jgi:hypothetical protein
MGEPGIEQIRGFLARVERKFRPEKVILSMHPHQEIATPR